MCLAIVALLIFFFDRFFSISFQRNFFYYYYSTQFRSNRTKCNERMEKEKEKKRKTANSRCRSEHLFCGLVARASARARLMGIESLGETSRQLRVYGGVCNRKRQTKVNSEVAIRQKSFLFHLLLDIRWNPILSYPTDDDNDVDNEKSGNKIKEEK